MSSGFSRLTPKALGFTRSLFAVACRVRLHFSIAFQVLVVSVQPGGNPRAKTPTMLVYFCTGDQQFPMLQGRPFNKRAKNFTHPRVLSAIRRSILPPYKRPSGFVFCEAVEELLEGFRSV